MLSSLDLTVEERSYYVHLLTSKRPRLGQSSLNDKPFLVPPIVDPTVDSTVDILSLQPETSLSLFASLCKRISSLQETSENIRVDSFIPRQQLILRQQTFGGELTLLQDRLGCDPGLTEVPLRSSYWGISFVHSLVKDSLHNNVVYPLLHQEIVQLLKQSMSPTLVTLHAPQQQVVDLERVLISHLPPLSQLHTICSGGVSKPPAEALTERLPSSSLGGFGLTAPPSVPSPSSTQIVELNAKFARLQGSYSNLKLSIGQEVVSLEGVKFESLW